MSESKRFFENKIPNYAGEEIKISENDWKKKLLLIVSMIKAREPYKTDGGALYTGAAGIAFMFQYLARLPIFVQEREQFMQDALNYVNASLSSIKSKKRDKNIEPAFLSGYSGIYAVAAVVHNALGKKNDSEKYLDKFINAGDVLAPYIKYEADEFLVGRAGYLSGALWLQNEFGEGVIPKDLITNVCDAMIQSGRDYALKNKSPCPLMYAYYEREYLGAAHGLSSILQVILSIPECLQGDPTVEEDVRTSVDYLLSLQSPSGNFPSVTSKQTQRRQSKSDPFELVQWCHGAPGVVYLMAKAFLHWQDTKYLDSCKLCGEITWQKGLLWKGPGICHGVAGNAYVFLLLYRLVQDEMYLYRALKFAQFMFTPEFEKDARTPDNPYSFYEGWAGTACFLGDLTRIDEACFPFMHVF